MCPPCFFNPCSYQKTGNLGVQNVQYIYLNLFNCGTLFAKRAFWLTLQQISSLVYWGNRTLNSPPSLGTFSSLGSSITRSFNGIFSTDRVLGDQETRKFQAIVGSLIFSHSVYKIRHMLQRESSGSWHGEQPQLYGRADIPYVLKLDMFGCLIRAWVKGGGDACHVVLEG